MRARVPLWSAVCVTVFSVQDNYDRGLKHCYAAIWALGAHIQLRLITQRTRRGSILFDSSNRLLINKYYTTVL